MTSGTSPSTTCVAFVGCGAEDLLLATRRVNQAGPAAGRSHALGLGGSGSSGPGGRADSRGSDSLGSDSLKSDSVGSLPWVLAKDLVPLLLPYF